MPDRDPAVTRLDPEFRWPGGRRICVVFNLAFEGWSDGVAPPIGPMGNVLKPGVLDTNAISWADYGGTRGIWRLLAELDRSGVKASVMVNGVMAERYPEAVRAIVAAGHEIVPHSWGMDVVPVYLDAEGEAANLDRTLAALDRVGARGRGWISPRGTPGHTTLELLAARGFDWFGDVFDDDLPYLRRVGERDMVCIPLTMEINDLPFSMRYGNPPPDLPAVLDALLARFRDGEAGPCYADVTAHTHVYGRPLGAAAYARMLDAVNGADDIWVATRAEVADHLRAELGAARAP